MTGQGCEVEVTCAAGIGAVEGVHDRGDGGGVRGVVGGEMRAEAWWR